MISYPVYTIYYLTSMQTNMKFIHIYDIGEKTWYTQEASAEGGNFPRNRYRFCAVHASAADGSSHNIFIYGGMNDSATVAFNDVYVLSIPSFHWVYLSQSAPKSAH